MLFAYIVTAGKRLLTLGSQEAIPDHQDRFRGMRIAVGKRMGRHVVATYPISNEVRNERLFPI